MEVDVPVHSTTEWFVLRLTTAAESIVFQRGALSALFIVPLRIFERDAACNTIRPVSGNRNGRFTYLVYLVATLDAIYGIAQRPRGAVLHCDNDSLSFRAVWIDPGFLSEPENSSQVIRAKAGVLANAAIVQKRDL